MAISNTLAEALIKIGVDDKTVANGLGNTQKRTERLGAGFNKLASIAKVAFASISAAVAGSVVKFAQFEKSMLTTKAIMADNLTGEEFQKLTGLARELGATTAFTATQAADALTTLSRAGNTAGQQMDLLPKTLSLAAAGNIDLAQSADIMSRVMKGMKLESSQAGDVIDTLAAAANTANTDISELGAAFAKIGPIGQAQGRSMKELAAAVQVLADGGSRGAQGGNALKRILSRLISPTGEAASIMNRFNIQTQDATGRLLPLADVVDQLRVAFSKMTEAQRSQAAAAIAGQHAQAEFNILVAAGGDELRDKEQALGKVEGTAKRMLNAMLGGTSGFWKKFLSSVEGVAIAFGEQLAPAANVVLKAMTSLMVSAKEFVETNKGFVLVGLAFNMIGTAAEGLKETFDKIGPALQTSFDMATKPVQTLIDKMLELSGQGETVEKSFSRLQRFSKAIGEGKDHFTAVRESAEGTTTISSGVDIAKGAMQAAKGLVDRASKRAAEEKQRLIIEDFDPKAIDKFKFGEEFKAIRDANKEQQEAFVGRRIERNEKKLGGGLDNQSQLEAKLRRITAGIATESSRGGPLQITSAVGFNRSLTAGMGGTDKKMLAVLQKQKETVQKQLEEQKMSNRKLQDLIDKDTSARFTSGGNPEE